jgi:hypothetical protein
MKRALITIATVGILAPTTWVVAANAQANINPNVYPGNVSEQYGARAPWEWHAGPGNAATCASPTSTSIVVMASKGHARPQRGPPLNGPPPAAELRPANSLV